MLETSQEIIGVIAYLIEVAGVLVILVGVSIAAWHFALAPHRLSSHSAYIEFRHRMGRAVILGLDFLVAGDIIKTIVVESSLGNVGVLALIVLIRTVLSLMLHVEVEGRWPWQAAPGPHAR
ncbi:MAG: DUF1622 domain-containing protein [Chromatiales bacterium]|nr:DUF1622 domain-containing protein [Chromatiales bacterium]